MHKTSQFDSVLGPPASSEVIWWASQPLVRMNVLGHRPPWWGASILPGCSRWHSQRPPERVNAKSLVACEKGIEFLLGMGFSLRLGHHKFSYLQGTCRP